MDDLDDLLAPQPARHFPQAELRKLTTSRLQLRARLRRAAKLVSIILVFALGGVVGWFAKPAPDPVVEYRPVVVPVLIPPEEPPSAVPVVAKTPERLELDAELADGPASADLYRRAGDAFLSAGRIESAVRCYRNHLAGARSVQLQADDSWLLVSLKNSRAKEGGS